MAKIDYSKRNDSGQYYLSINGLKDACGYMSEVKEVEHLESAIVATWKHVSGRIRIKEVKLIDRLTGKVVGFGLVPYDVILEPDDSLTVTFCRSVKIVPRGVDMSL